MGSRWLIARGNDFIGMVEFLGSGSGRAGVVGLAEIYSRASPSDRAIKLSQCGSGVGRGLGSSACARFGRLLSAMSKE